jgi:uncharacterized protein (TIGR02145 family)
MKKIMKKQCKKIPSWGCKVFLSVALISLVVVAHAQGADICAGSPYTIASAVDASGATTYQWLENGRLISGASAATYLVPADKAVENYTYIRQAKSPDCSEWQSSNEFVVTVFNCSFSAGTATGATATFTDPRDGKRYKTVVMPDGKTWFAQNLNYTKDLTFNASVFEANGKPYASPGGAFAIGSYWCSGVPYSTSSEKKTCDVFGALYSLQTALMIDGKYNDASKTSSTWDNTWEYPGWYPPTAISINVGAASNHARGGGQGICPKGWHIPTLLEWAQLLDAVGGDKSYTSLANVYIHMENGVGQKLRSVKVAAESHKVLDGSWPAAYAPGTDDYGFTVLPAGQMSHAPTNVTPYIDVGSMGRLLTSSQWGQGYATVVDFMGVTTIRFANAVSECAIPLRCCAD